MLTLCPFAETEQVFFLPSFPENVQGPQRCSPTFQNFIPVSLSFWCVIFIRSFGYSSTTQQYYVHVRLNEVNIRGWKFSQFTYVIGRVFKIPSTSVTIVINSLSCKSFRPILCFIAVLVRPTNLS